MSLASFEGFLRELVVPMFPGVTLDRSAFRPINAIVTTVVLESPTRLRVRQTSVATDFWELNRLQTWQVDEVALMRALIASFAAVDGVVAKSVVNQLEDYVLRDAIAGTVSRGTQAVTLRVVLETLSNWASQTYEGERISAGIVIERSTAVGPVHLSLLELMKEDFAKVLSDGVDSWWRTDSRGQVTGFDSTDSITVMAPGFGYFPLRYSRLVERTKDGAVAIALNRNGELLLFASGRLRFAKRRGKWVHFSHEAVVTSMSWGPSPRDVREAVYQSCLDVSFARSGACIGMVRPQNLARFYANCPVSKDDLLEAPIKLKPVTAAKLISRRPFHELPRLLRKELLSLDGALVLRLDGVVLAAGAILELAGVQRGNHGGRSAAAQALAPFGMGIKVSEDGLISGYRAGGAARAAFTLG